MIIGRKHLMIFVLDSSIWSLRIEKSTYEAHF